MQGHVTALRMALDILLTVSEQSSPSDNKCPSLPPPFKTYEKSINFQRVLASDYFFIFLLSLFTLGT
jgi:hypothetical protein